MLSNKKDSVVFAAARSENMKLMMELSKSDELEFSKSSTDGRHALWVASFMGRKEMVEFLGMLYKGSGVDIDKAGFRGSSSLFVAAQEGWFDIVEMLVGDFGAKGG